jgi:transposase
LILLDNAAYHRSLKTREFIEKLSLSVMYLGPDQFAMAPVEKFFAFIKARDLNPLMSKAYSK